MAIQSVNRDYSTRRLVSLKANPRQGLEAYSTTRSVSELRRISPYISSGLAAPCLSTSVDLWVDREYFIILGNNAFNSLRWRIIQFEAKV